MSLEDRLRPFLLDGVSVARGEKKEDQSGSYGYVFEVEIGKVVHIAKKPHTAFLRRVSEGEKKRVISKFREECVLLSKLRHPNIVQFVGVYYGPGGRDDIALVMEKLECDLAGFLEDNQNIDEQRKLVILQDVSYGLVYLHEYNPPIIHRDLTARNILLSQSYQAKIADVGVAKLMDEKAKQAESHTQTPGQMYYMPPEARRENAVYTSKLDMFSFGHLSLHTVLGDYPVVYEDDITPEVLQKGNAQIMKRRSSLSRIGNQHCLYPSIVKCLMDNPEMRPTAREMNNMLNHLVLERNQHKYDSLTTENKALKCLLSKANQEMAGITESLQEAEKKSCHLEQLVAEARHALQSQTELQEAEVEIERLRGLLENAGGGEEKVGELESENGQLHKTVKELTEDLAKSQGKSEEMMNHFANVIEQTKTIRLALMTKDSEIMRLQEENQSLLADKDALSDLLIKADRKKSQINEGLQESEKERADWEIRAGRLEQLVKETRHELTRTNKQLDETFAHLKQGRAALVAMDEEKRTLLNLVSVHETRLQEAEVEIERLRGLLENARGGEEKVGELEAENGQLNKTVKELAEDLAKSQGKSEAMMNHFANVIEQTKTIRLALMTKDSEIMRLQEENQSLVADKDALSDLLSKADRKKSQINEGLQESEKERADWEIRAGRLEQLVKETRHELTRANKQLDETFAHLKQGRAALVAMDEEKRTLLNLVSVHETRLQEAEVEIERLRGLLESAGGGAEKVGELEAENGQLHKTVKELEEDLAKSQGKSEEMMNHMANIIEQTKTIRLFLMAKESEVKKLQEENQSLGADKDALFDLLSKIDREKSQINERLQESEKERADWEIRAGRLEQLVKETRHDPAGNLMAMRFPSDPIQSVQLEDEGSNILSKKDSTLPRAAAKLDIGGHTILAKSSHATSTPYPFHTGQRSATISMSQSSSNSSSDEGINPGKVMVSGQLSKAKGSTESSEEELKCPGCSMKWQGPKILFWKHIEKCTT